MISRSDESGDMFLVPRFVSQSRLEFDKFSPDVIEIYKGVLDAIPNGHLVIVGDGKGRWTLERKVWQLSLQDRCTFLGARTDVVEILQTFDVFVYPVEIEFFGLVVIEAMACGVPVVASKVGSLPELITDGETGYLVESEDEFPNKAMLALKKKTQIRQKAYEKVIKLFTAERMVGEYVEIYRKVKGEA